MDDRSNSAVVQADQQTAPPVQAAPDASQLPVQQNQAPPAPAQPVAQPEHRSFLSSVLGALSSVFGGPKTHKEATPEGGVQDVQNTTGQRVAGGIGNALAIAGSTLSGHNYVGDIQKEQQQQDQNAESQAKLTQNEILNKASMAHMAQETASSAWQMQRQQTDVDKDTAGRIAQYQQIVSSDPNNRDWGTYASFADFLKGHSDLKTNGVNLAQLQAQGKIVAVPTTEGGKITGVRVFQVEPQWTDKKNSEPFTFKYPNGMDDKGNVKYEDRTIPAGAMSNGDMLKYFGQTSHEALQADQKKAELKIQQQLAATKQEAVDKKPDQAAGGGAIPAKLQGALMSGTDANGNQIAGTMDEMKAAGVKNPVKMGQGEADKVNVARQLTSPTGLFAMAKQNISQFKPEELTALNGRWNEFMTGTVGSGDPRYVKLRTDLALLSTALMQAHVGSKGGEAFMEHFANLANAGKMDGKTLTAAIDEEQQYVNEKAMRAKAPAAAGGSGGFDFSKFQAVKQ